MKNNKLLLGSAAFAGALLFSATLYLNNTAQYSPRTNEQTPLFGATQGALGAAQWLFDMQKNPTTGRIDEADVLKSREEVAQFMLNNPNSNRAPLGLQWTELGPDNVGGRTRGILIDKNNPNKIYATSVSGGLWISNNSGSNWAKYNDQLENMNMTCITQAANGDIYIGTGEDLYNGIGPGNLGSGLLGGGIYKSSDGGVTFTRLTSTIPTVANSASQSAGNEFIGVNNLGADPTNANRIYAACATGLRMTNDGGVTWTHAATQTSGTPITTRSTDVDVATDGTVIASIGHRLYISANGDQATYTIAATTAGLPTSGLARIEFAIAPSDPNYMYALAGKSSNGLLEGVYQSTNKGLNWTKIGNGGSSQFEIFGTGQAAYDNTIAVFPNNKTKIIVGGVTMWSWKQTTAIAPGVGQWSLAATLGGFTTYVHADVHTFKFHPNGSFYIGCDGGVFRGIESGNAFLYQEMNRGYNVTQFYSVAYQGDGLYGTGVMGGTQDNGTNYILGTGNTIQEAIEVGGGDGAECEISYLNPNASFTTVYYGALNRHSSKGGGPAPAYSSRVTKLANYTTPGFASFVTPIALYETKTATNSPDSLRFINGPQSQVAGLGDGINKRFTGFLTLPYSSASFAPDSVVFTSGTQTVNDDNAGNLSGSVSGASNTINYATGYYDFNFAIAPPLGAAVNISYDVMYNIGSNLSFTRPQFVSPLNVITSNVIKPSDTVNFYDPFQAKLAVGFTGAVWMTKEALNFSSTPEWFKLGTVLGTVEEMVWTEDGDILYVGTSGGQLFRFANLAAVKDSANGDVASPGTVVVKTQIGGLGATICGLSVDPSNNNRLAVSLGGYGQTNHVYYSATAATCAASSVLTNFSLKQGTGTTKLPAMPVYSILIEKNDPKRAIVATEHGIYSTEDITVAAPVWSSENGTGTSMFPNVATYDIRQQRRDGSVVNNPFVIYAGTHARGIWKSSSLIGPVTVGVNNPIDNTTVSASFQSSLNVYPNPMNNLGTVAFELEESTNIVVSVYSLQGKLVKTIKAGKLQSGNQKVEINSEELSKGSYLISVDGTNVHATTRFVVVK